MSLGDYFPATAREVIIKQRLVPGAVLYLPFTFPRDGKTKEKYMVVVATIAPKLLLFVINTEVNQLIARTPELNRCNIRIDHLDHTFLSYDSNLACHEVMSIDMTMAANHLNNDMSRYRGQISEQIKQKILQVISTKPKTISKVHRDAITSALS